MVTSGCGRMSPLCPGLAGSNRRLVQVFSERGQYGPFRKMILFGTACRGRRADAHEGGGNLITLPGRGGAF